MKLSKVIIYNEFFFFFQEMLLHLHKLQKEKIQKVWMF